MIYLFINSCIHHYLGEIILYWLCTMADEQNDQTLSFHGAYILIRQKPGNYIHTNIHIYTCKRICNVEAEKN